jgi:hypothetical protein
LPSLVGVEALAAALLSCLFHHAAVFVDGQGGIVVGEPVVDAVIGGGALHGASVRDVRPSLREVDPVAFAVGEFRLSGTGGSLGTALLGVEAGLIEQPVGCVADERDGLEATVVVDGTDVLLVVVAVLVGRGLRAELDGDAHRKVSKASPSSNAATRTAATTKATMIPVWRSKLYEMSDADRAVRPSDFARWWRRYSS